ncbi:MAG: hypothetical protein HYV36_05785 [Lentisphaerae bacterium]|nr:hypothetical protein [Lentisphaerota bacterium]
MEENLFVWGLLQSSLCQHGAKEIKFLIADIHLLGNSKHILGLHLREEAASCRFFQNDWLENEKLKNEIRIYAFDIQVIVIHCQIPVGIGEFGSQKGQESVVSLLTVEFALKTEDTDCNDDTEKNRNQCGCQSVPPIPALILRKDMHNQGVDNSDGHSTNGKPYDRVVEHVNAKLSRRTID